MNISELSKSINLVNYKTNKPLNHVIRYWEKEFKQIKPQVIKKRRYYSEKQVNLIRLIKFLLKEKGMTINGVKNLLKSNINSLDDYHSDGLKTDYQKEKIKSKSKIILEKIKNIKRYGKKITH